MKSLYLILVFFISFLGNIYSQTNDDVAILELKQNQVQYEATNKSILDKVDTLNATNDKIITIFYSSIGLILTCLIGVNLYYAYDHKKHIKEELQRLSKELEKRFEDEKIKIVKDFQSKLDKINNDSLHKSLVSKLKRHPEYGPSNYEINNLLHLVRITPYVNNFSTSDTVKTVALYLKHQKEIFIQEDIDEIIDILKSEYPNNNYLQNLIKELERFE